MADTEPKGDDPEEEKKENSVMSSVEVTESTKTKPKAARAAKPKAAKAAKTSKVPQARTEEEKNVRKERVAMAKDALSRSVGIKGEHVIGARAALKTFLQRLNEPNQPDDARFEMLIEAPFRAPEKKKTNDRRF